MELPMLIQRCLTYGIKIYPFQLEGVMKQYESKKIPDDVLAYFNADQVKEYVKGLEYSAREDSRDWSQGHDILKGIGFKETERVEGHRKFISLQYKTQ